MPWGEKSKLALKQMYESNALARPVEIPDVDPITALEDMAPVSPMPESIKKMADAAKRRQEAKISPRTQVDWGDDGILNVAVDKAWRAFKHGTAGLGQLAGTGLELSADKIPSLSPAFNPMGRTVWSEAGRNLREYSKQAAADNESYDLLKEFEWSDLGDPDFYLTKGVGMIPMLTALIPVAVAGGAVGAGIGTAAGLGTVGTMAVSATMSALFSRPMESSMEALGTYNQLIDEGKSPEIAAKEAAGVFKKNLLLTGMDAAQYALAFAKFPAPMRNSFMRFAQKAASTKVARVGGFTAAGLSEGAEEVMQQYFQEQATLAANGQPDLDFWTFITEASPETKEAFALGTLMGFGFQSVGAVKKSLSKEQVDQIVNEAANEVLSKVPKANQYKADVIAGLNEAIESQEKAQDRPQEAEEGQEPVTDTYEAFKGQFVLSEEDFANPQIDAVFREAYNMEQQGESAEAIDEYISGELTRLEEKQPDENVGQAEKPGSDLIEEARKYKNPEEFKALGFDKILEDLRGVKQDEIVTVPTENVKIIWDEDYRNAKETARKDYNPKTSEPVEFIYDIKTGKYELDDGHNRFVAAQNAGAQIKGVITKIRGNLEELANIYQKEKGISIADVWANANQKPTEAPKPPQEATQTPKKVKESPKPVEGQEAAKEPWEMTRAEYESEYGKPTGKTTVTGGFSPHKQEIEVALRQGKPVPAEVLADYPELQVAPAFKEGQRVLYTPKRGRKRRMGKVGSIVERPGQKPLYMIDGESYTEAQLEQLASEKGLQSYWAEIKSLPEKDQKRVRKESAQYKKEVLDNYEKVLPEELIERLQEEFNAAEVNEKEKAQFEQALMNEVARALDISPPVGPIAKSEALGKLKEYLKENKGEPPKFTRGKLGLPFQIGDELTQVRNEIRDTEREIGAEQRKIAKFNQQAKERTQRGLFGATQADQSGMFGSGVDEVQQAVGKANTRIRELEAKLAELLRKQDTLEKRAMDEGQASLFQQGGALTPATEAWNRNAEKVLSKVGVAEVVYDPKQFTERGGAEAQGALGFYDPETNKIYINADKANKDTIFHEYTHPVVNKIKRDDPKLYAQGRELVKGTKYERDAQDYADPLDEGLVQAIGEMGAKIENNVQRSKFRNWVRKLYMAVKKILKDAFGLNMTLDEFTEHVATGMRTGKFTGISAEAIQKQAEDMRKTPAFKRWFGNSKVVDENGDPLVVYSGHANAELYENFDPRKATAGGFYASEDPNIASSYAIGKLGAKEFYEKGNQYRIKGKNGKYNKKIWQIELTESQKKTLDKIGQIKDEYGDNIFHVDEMMRWAKDNKDYDPLARRIALTGKYNLQNIFDFNEQTGYNIAYPKEETSQREPYFLRQEKNETEEILDRLGIEWQSYDWSQPGVFPVFLSIQNPIDASKPFPKDLLKALKDKSKRERIKTDQFGMVTGIWTKEYPLKQWVRDIEEGYEYWSTQIPKKAIPIIKEFGYDGIKELGLKSFKDDTRRQVNWIAFDPTQIKSIFNRGTFDPSDPRLMFQKIDAEQTSIVPEAQLDLPDETLFQKAQRFLQNKMNRLNQVVQLAKENRNIPDERDPALQAELMVGRASDKIKRLQDDLIDKPNSFAKRLIKDGYTIEQFGEYLHARHAKERNAVIAKRNDQLPDGGSGMTNAEAQAILDKYSKDKRLQSYADEFYNTVTKKRLQLLLDSGLIKPELYDILTKQYKNYVPLKRVMDKPSVMTPQGKGFSVEGKDIKRAKGSLREVINPMVAAIADYEASIVRAEKNAVGKTFLGLVEQNPNPDLWGVKRVKVVPRLDLNTGEPVFTFDNMARQDEIIVKDEGKDVYIRIKDKPLLNAMKNLGATKAIPILGDVNNWLRTVNIMLNPEFMITNFERDLQTALINMSGEQSGKFAKDITKKIPSAMRGIWQDVRYRPNSKYAKAYQELAKEGGKIGWFDWRTLEEKAKILEKKIKRYQKQNIPTKALTEAGKYIRDLNEVVESGVRLSTYMTAIEYGFSKQKAAQLAKNVTVNFNKKGEYGQIIDTLYLFANAGIQGGARIFKALQKKRTRRIVLGLVALGALQSAIMRAKDEDQWEQFSPWVKDNYWIFPIGGDKSLTIKVPYGYNVFKVLGNVTEEIVSGKTDISEAMKRMMAAINDAFNPLGSAGSLGQYISPTGTDYFVQVAENKNFFGAPIKPEQPFYAPKKPESQLYYKSVRQSSKMLTDFLNKVTGGSERVSGYVDLSPEYIDHTIDFVFGGAGRFAVNTVNGLYEVLENHDVPNIKNTPVLRQFIKEPNEYTALSIARRMRDESLRTVYTKNERELFEWALQKAVENEVLSNKMASQMLKSFRRNQVKAQISLDNYMKEKE